MYPLMAFFACLVVGAPQDPRTKAATSEPLGEVVARVGDEVVTRGELVAVVKRLRAFGQEAELLRLIVEQKLLRQMATRSKVKVEDPRVEASIERKARMNGSTREEFEQRVLADGWTREELIENERDSLLLAELIRNRPDLRQRMQVTPAEMLTYYEAHLEEEFVRPAGAELETIKVYEDPNGGEAEAERLARDLATRWGAGEAPEEMLGGLQGVSAGPLLDPQGKPLGPVSASAPLAPAIVEFLRSEPPAGKVSAPLDLGTFLLILRVKAHSPRKVHPFEDRVVQNFIRARLEEAKEAAIRRRYVFEILHEFDLWPPDLFGPLPPRGS
ncbi:MAG: hypothetical protein AB1486_32260 [Planctomycetota bacterium]